MHIFILNIYVYILRILLCFRVRRRVCGGSILGYLYLAFIENIRLDGAFFLRYLVFVKVRYNDVLNLMFTIDCTRFSPTTTTQFNCSSFKEDSLAILALELIQIGDLLSNV